MLKKEQVEIQSVDIGNIGDTVAFKLNTNEGDMHLNMHINSAKSMIDLLQTVVDKIEAGGHVGEDR